MCCRKVFKFVIGCKSMATFIYMMWNKMHLVTLTKRNVRGEQKLTCERRET